MRIKSIALNNFKGVSQTHDLDTLNLIIGPNGSGKSAIILATSFGVLGSTSLGKTHEATAQLGGARGCGVSLILDDGFTANRNLKRKRDGGLSMSVGVEGQGMNTTQAGAAIKEHCGDFAPMFDLGAFADLSDDKKRAFVLDLCARGKRGPVDPADLLARIAAESCNEIVGGAGGGVSLISNNEKECLDEAMGKLTKHLEGFWTPPYAIATALKEATSLANAAKTLEDEALATVRTLSESKTQLGDLPADSVDVITEKIGTIEAERNGIAKQLGLQEGKAAALHAAQKVADDVRAKIAACKIGLEELGASPDQSLMARMEAEIEEWKSKPREELLGEDCASEHFRANEAHQAAAEHWVAVSQALATVKADVAFNERELEQLKTSPWSELDGLFRSLQKLQDGDTFTDEVCTIFSTIRGIIAQQTSPGLIAAFTGQIQKAQKSLEDALTGFAKATDKKNGLDEKKQEAGEALRKAEEHDNAAYKRKEQREGDIRRLTATLDDMRRKLSDHNHVYDTCSAAIELGQEDRLNADKRLEEIRLEGGQIDAAALETQKKGLGDQITALRSQIDARRRHDHVEAELQSASAKAKHQETAQDVLKGVCRAIRVIRGEMMQELVQPLLGHMNRFLGVAAPGRTAYCRLINEKDTPIFELGWMINGERRPYPALSGGEHVMYGCALAYALVVLADPPLKLLLAECGEIDAVNLSLLMDGLEAVSGDLSNVMIATHSVVGAASSKWNTIHAERLSDDEVIDASFEVKEDEGIKVIS